VFELLGIEGMPHTASCHLWYLWDPLFIIQ